MKSNSHSENLALAIAHLESRQHNEWLEIKNQISVIKENLKPLNVLKTVIEEVKDNIVNITGSRNNLLKIGVGLGANYLIHKLAINKSQNKFKNFMGSLLLSTVSKLVDRI
jgi:hypothetical protein